MGASKVMIRLGEMAPVKGRSGGCTELPLAMKRGIRIDINGSSRITVTSISGVSCPFRPGHSSMNRPKVFSPGKLSKLNTTGLLSFCFSGFRQGIKNSPRFSRKVIRRTIFMRAPIFPKPPLNLWRKTISGRTSFTRMTRRRRTCR